MEKESRNGDFLQTGDVPRFEYDFKRFVVVQFVVRMMGKSFLMVSPVSVCSAGLGVLAFWDRILRIMFVCK